MKTYSGDLTAALTGEQVTIEDLALAFEFRFVNEEVVRIAEVTVDTEIGAYVWQPAAGLRRGSIDLEINAGPTSLDVELVAYAGGPITYEDVQDGVLDNAEVSVYVFRRDDPDSSLDLLFWGDVTDIRRGNFGAVEFTIDGPLGRQTEFINKIYSATCRHRFTSPECGVDPASVTFDGVIVSASGRFITVSGTGGQATDFFRVGLLRMTSGRILKNRAREIKESTLTDGNQVLELYRDFGGINPAPGDTCTVRRGCTHDFDPNFGNRFYNNARRYGGEPRIESDDDDVVHVTAEEEPS